MATNQTKQPDDIWRQQRAEQVVRQQQARCEPGVAASVINQMSRHPNALASCPTHRHTSFDYNPTKCQFTAEASGLGRGWMGRIYNDACDVGFYMQGLNKTVLFTLNREHNDDEGDITHWSFISMGQGCTAVVFND